MKAFFRDLGIVFGALLIGGAIVYGIMRFQEMHSSSSATAAAQNEINTVVSEVGKLMELPKETPTVATVSDIAKLKDQPFFVNAKDGDKVLIYVQAKKAILYRPSENKIIEVAPLNIQNSPVPMQSGPTPQANANTITVAPAAPTPTQVIIIHLKPTEATTPTQGQ